MAKYFYANVVIDEETGKKKPYFGKEWGKLPKAEANTKCMATGKESDTTVIDYDGGEEMEKEWARLLGEPTYRTARGAHWHFDYVPEIKQTQGLLPHMDVRNDGGLVFVKYWGDDDRIQYRKVGRKRKMSEELKQKLIAASRERTKRESVKYESMVAEGEPWARVPDGEQHEGLRILCQESFKKGMSYDQVAAKHLEYLDNYLDRSAHEIGLMEGRLSWASDLFEKGGSLKGETLTPPPAVVDAEVVEFEMQDTYDECIAEAAKLRASDKIAEAVSMIKSEFKVPVADIRKDIMNKVASDHKDEFVYPDYEFTQYGEIRYLATVPNLQKAFKKMGIKAYYDVISKEVVVTGYRNRGKDNWRATLRSDVTSYCIKTGLPPSIIDLHFDAMMMFNEKNPLLKAVKKTKWDGKDHLKKLAKRIHVKGSDKYKREGLKRWMVQCVAAWDGAKRTPLKQALPKYEMILVMQSKQGVKKTSFFGKLLPGKLRKYFLDGASLHVKDKDSVMTLLQHGIVELGELDATFKKSDISDIKSFASKQVDKIRPPYGRDILDRKRRTVMCSSVNDAQFLNDPSGARRFFVMAVTKLDSIDDIDMMQVWAQVWDMYKNGQKWWFESDEKWVKIRDAENEMHRESGLYGDLVADLKQKIEDGHIFPARISASALYETLTGSFPKQGEAAGFARELIASGFHRNSARMFEIKKKEK